MYNIAIENDTKGYTFLVHNNPSMHPLKIIAKSLSKFRYELDKVDTALLTSTLVLNIAQLDSKKKPSFYLGIRSNCGENHAPIVVISIKSQAIGAFDERGRMISKWAFGDILSQFDDSPEEMSAIPRSYEKATKAPESFKFD